MCQKYLEAVRSFNLEEAFENLEPHCYHWRVDPFEVNRYVSSAVFLRCLPCSANHWSGISSFWSCQFKRRFSVLSMRRVWYTTRVTGTHTKTLSVFGKKFKPTYKTVLGGPEQQSLVFNETGQVKIFTGGW